MGILTTACPELGGFCQGLIERCGDPGLLAPSLFGEELQQHFAIPPAASRIVAEHLCRRRLGIAVEYRDDIPLPMKGHHIFHAGRLMICVPRNASDFQARTTIIHELGEIAVDVLVELMPSCSFDRDAMKDGWWDTFAHGVLLPSGWFRQQLLETGFDLPMLQQRTTLSYAGITIRAGDVCEPDIPVFALHIERDRAGDHASSLRVKTFVWTQAWLGFGYRGKGNEVFPVPRQGTLIATGSAVHSAVTSRRSGEMIAVAEQDGSSPQEVAVRLIVPRPNPAAGRVMVVGVPADNRHLFHPPLVGEGGPLRRMTVSELW